MRHQIQYGKISLRPLEPEDISLLYRWENDMELWEVSNTRTPFSKYILTQYLQNSGRDIYETKQLRLIIENELSNSVGAIDLFDFDPYHLRAGVGVLIHKKEDRQQGYAYDSLAALSQYSVQSLGLRQLYATIAEDNLPSIKLFLKAGFEETGRKKSWLKTRTGWKDALFMQKILF